MARNTQPHSGRKTGAALFPILVGLLFSSVAHAQPEGGEPRGGAERDEEMARSLFDTGRRYFERAQYEQAAEAFAEAYRLSGRVQLLINQARALESAGDVAGAIEALELAITGLAEDDPIRATAEARLNRLLAEENRRGAEEAARGTREGERSSTQATGAPTATGSDPGRGPVFFVGVGALGLSGASLIVALGTGLRAHAIHRDLEDSCPGDLCDPALEPERDKGRRLSRASTATLFVGAGAGIAGVLMMVLAPDSGGHADASTAARLRPTPGPGDVGMGLEGRF